MTSLLHLWRFVWLFLFFGLEATWRPHIRNWLVWFLLSQYFCGCSILLILGWGWICGEVLGTGLVCSLVSVGEFLSCSFSLFIDLQLVKGVWVTYIIRLVADILAWALLAAAILNDWNPSFALDSCVFTEHYFLFWEDLASWLGSLLWAIFSFLLLGVVCFVTIGFLGLSVCVRCQMLGHKSIWKFILCYSRCQKFRNSFS